MAITTLDGAVAGMRPPVELVKAATPTLVAGRPHSLFYLAGVPGAAEAPSPGIGGAPVTSYTGQLPFSDPVSGNTYLARLQAQASVAGSLLLCDRLWHNSGMSATATTEQTFTSSADIPARDRNGAATGDDVQAGIEFSAAGGAAAPIFTLKYNNTAGASKTATNSFRSANSPAVGAFYPIGLAAGDLGIQRATSLTLSVSQVSGTFHVVLYRVIARLELTGANVPNAIDALTSGFPQLYNSCVPFFLFIPSAATASNVSAQVIYTQG